MIQVISNSINRRTVQIQPGDDGVGLMISFHVPPSISQRERTLAEHSKDQIPGCAAMEPKQQRGRTCFMARLCRWTVTSVASKMAATTDNHYWKMASRLNHRSYVVFSNGLLITITINIRIIGAKNSWMQVYQPTDTTMGLKDRRYGWSLLL